MKSVNNLLWCVCLFVFISFPYFFSMVGLFAFFPSAFLLVCFCLCICAYFLEVLFHINV